MQTVCSSPAFVLFALHNDGVLCLVSIADRRCTDVQQHLSMTMPWLQWEQRPGETIYKGHRSYDLMLNLQLGIRWSISRNARDPVLKNLPTSVFSEKVNLASLL